jgi:voltage-gated potassium channel
MMASNPNEPPQVSEGAILPWLRRYISGGALTARRAAVAIAMVTLTVTLLGGVLIRVLDPDDFPSIGSGIWWSVQTLTTVGYGDVVPENTIGRVIATVVMLNGIAFLTVITAAVTALLIEGMPRSRAQDDLRKTVVSSLDEIGSRLDAIESTLGERGDRPARGGP